MFPVFEIKAFLELTWEDIPFIELPTFGHEHALAALFGRHDFFGASVRNIDAFKNREVPHFHPHSNYHVIEQQLHYLFYQGHYFSVARHGIPFGASFTWRALEAHLDGGEWSIPHRVYGDPLKQKLEDLAKRLGAQKRRMMAEQAAETSPAALIPVVKRVVEKSVVKKPASQPAPPPKAAQSLDECANRLELARERLCEQGYQAKYTDEQIKALAQKGELDDRFVVRIIETKYAGDDGYVGQKSNGEVKYWSTTFNQMENGDTDPPTLCGLIGVDYKPGGSYTLVIVDTQAKGAGQSVTIVPTHEKLGDFAKSEIKGINPEAVDSVMTPEYNSEYAEHMTAFKKQDLNIDKEKDIKRYADAKFSSKEDKAQFKTRMKIHERLGANEYYTGDGTTKNLIAGCPSECGVMETFTYDKNPQTLGRLETDGHAKRIVMKLI